MNSNLIHYNTRLPEELEGYILSYLPKEDLSKFSSVCTEWNKYINNQYSIREDYRIFRRYMIINCKFKSKRNNLNKMRCEDQIKLTLLGSGMDLLLFPQVIPLTLGALGARALLPLGKRIPNLYTPCYKIIDANPILRLKWNFSYLKENVEDLKGLNSYDEHSYKIDLREEFFNRTNNSGWTIIDKENPLNYSNSDSDDGDMSFSM